MFQNDSDSDAKILMSEEPNPDGAPQSVGTFNSGSSHSGVMARIESEITARPKYLCPPRQARVLESALYSHSFFFAHSTKVCLVFVSIAERDDQHAMLSSSRLGFCSYHLLAPRKKSAKDRTDPL